MKILLAHKFFKLTGGADFFFFEVARVLKEQGHEIAFFSTNSDNNLESEFSDYFIDAPNFKSRNPFKKIGSIRDIVYNKTASKKITELIKDFKPDIIHVFAIASHLSPSILEVGKRMNVPIVASFNDYKHICPNYKLYHHGRICESCKGGYYLFPILNKCAHDSFIFSTASAIESYLHSKWNIYQGNIDHFMFASEFMANKTKEFWNKADLSWSRVLNPFDSSQYQYRYTNEGYGLYFGRLIDEKGIDRLIYALEKTSINKFLIVGDGPQKDELNRYVKTKGIDSIQFLGSKWGEDLDKILLGAKFVVVPSIWHENYPYVILQSFAAGKPVLGSNRGGIPEIIMHGENGFVFDIDNQQDFIYYLGKMNQLSPKLIEEMGIKARAFVEENFGDKQFYKSILEVYEKVK